MDKNPTDPVPSYQFDPHPDSDIAFIGFAGLMDKKPVPDFAWGGMLSALPVSRLLVRDVAQFWYLYGLSGLAPDITDAAAILRQLLDSQGINHVVTVGASMGGYAALIYGALLGADEAIAFSPMTRIPSRPLINTVRNMTVGNWTIARKQIEVRLRRDFDRRYCDLRPFLQNDNGRTRYQIFYGDQHAADSRNARYLGDLPRVTLLPLPYGTHDVAVKLRNSGDLATVLTTSLSQLTSDHRPLTHDPEP